MKTVIPARAMKKLYFERASANEEELPECDVIIAGVPNQHYWIALAATSDEMKNTPRGGITMVSRLEVATPSARKKSIRTTWADEEVFPSVISVAQPRPKAICAKVNEDPPP